MTERWLPISGFEGVYEVSDLGRIKSLPRSRVPVDRILKPFANGSGHLLVDLRVNGQRHTVQVHLQVLGAFVGPTPAGMECRHLNGDPADNRLANLQYGTRSENTFDSVLHGTHPSSRVTHCPQNHEYTEDNTYVNPRLPRSRTCRVCMRQAQKDYRARLQVGVSGKRPGRPRKEAAA